MATRSIPVNGPDRHVSDPPCENNRRRAETRSRFELRRISERNLEAANANRRKGKPRNGFPAVSMDVADRILALRDSGATYRAIAAIFERENVPTARGGRRWEPATVRSAEITRRRELEARAAA